MDRSWRLGSLFFVTLLTLSAACASGSPAPQGAAPADRGEPAQPAQRKTLIMGVGAVLDAFSIAGSSNTGGGRLGFIEIHSQAMFTADKTTGRPMPRLLSEQPSLDNGGLRLTDDGRMIATYKVRPDVKWADGVPFTARDLVFTYEMLQERSLPFIDIGPSTLMQSAEAPDDTTFVITWKQPYYMADAIGLRAFWPMPAHLLQADFNTLVVEQRDTASFLAKPYWTTAYVHVGPYKLVQFTPGEDVVFEALPGYFLGRPKVDRIIVRQIADPTTMFAEIVAGSIDLASDNVLSGEQARDLRARWDASNGGKVYIGTGTTQFYAFQFDASVPNYNTAIQNRLARRALYHAIDRDSYSEVIVGFTGRAADALLPPDDTLYSYVRDGYKNAYPYDQGRAVATFEQAGWRRGSDGLLVNAAGEHVKMTTRISLGSQRQGTTVSDMWRQVGVDSEIVAVPAARTTDREFLQSFPGGEIVGRGSRDSVLTRLECAEMPTPQNAYAGNNRGHWCNQDYDRLVNQYRTDLTEAGRGRTMAQISNLTVDELPLLLLNVNTAVVFARTGVTAFTDDFAGGSEAGRIYGTYSRNAHEWDLQS